MQPITREVYENGLNCRGMCNICDQTEYCYQYKTLYSFRGTERKAEVVQLGSIATGFRNPGFQGADCYEAQNVICHEIFVLGNTDILATLNKGALSEARIKETIEKFLQDPKEPADVLLDNAELWWAFSGQLLNEIAVETGIVVKYALWLAKEEVVREMYFGTEDNIREYPTGEVLLSDLGKDGQLWGYSKMPVEIVSIAETTSLFES